MGFMRKPLLYSHMQSQGHVHDTIVVNQPQVPQGASTMVHEAAAAAGISGDKVYFTTQVTAKIILVALKGYETQC
jgi:hypothetical protein